MINRQERRARLSAFKKELRHAIFDDFKKVEIGNKVFPSGIGDFLGFYKNSIYSVQFYKRNKIYILGIRRHDEKPSCPWSDRQKIKNLLLGEEFCAIEFMPPENSKIDQANMYWIFAGEPVSFFYNQYGGIGGR